MKKGFTLIELLVAITIFSLLSSFVVANYRNNEKTRKLKNQTQLIVNGLEKAQNMALTGELTDNLSPLAYKFLIANCQADCFYQINAVFADGETVVSKNQLSGVKIETYNQQGLTVEFSLPRGRMKFGDDSSAVWLETNNGDSFYCVKVTAISGRIDLLNGVCQ